MLVSKTLNRHQNLGKFWETDSHIIKSTSTQFDMFCLSRFFMSERPLFRALKPDWFTEGVSMGDLTKNISRLSLLHVFVVLHDLLIFEGFWRECIFVSRPEDTSRRRSSEIIRLSSLHAEHLKDLSSKIEECHSLVQICSWTPVQSPPARWSPHVIKVPSCRRAAKAFPVVELFNAEPSESTDLVWNLEANVWNYESPVHSSPPIHSIWWDGFHSSCVYSEIKL